MRFLKNFPLMTNVFYWFRLILAFWVVLAGISVSEDIHSPSSFRVQPCTLYAGLEDHLKSGDNVANELLNSLDKKKKEVGSHPFCKGISSEASLSPSELKGKAEELSFKDPASQMVFKSSESRTQFKIDPQTDPLLTGAEEIRATSLEVIGGKGTKTIVTKHSGKDESFNCEEAGDPSLETCSRELKVKIIKTTVKKEWNGNFYISKCSNAERGGHYIPCASLRQSLFQAR